MTVTNRRFVVASWCVERVIDADVKRAGTSIA
jgi:hypothetical protein